MSSWIQDLRTALRGLAKRPGTTAAILLTLALGVGATTAIFSVVEGVLLRPLPFEEPDRLAQIWTQFPAQNAFEFPASEAEWIDYRDTTGLMEDVAAYTYRSLTATGRGEPERLRAIPASASLWSVLGVEAAHGRVFGPGEDRPGQDNVAVLSHGLWQRRFGGDPRVLGETLVLDGADYRVLGVVPAEFRFPDGDADLFIPLALDEDAIEHRYGHYLFLVGRLRPETTLQEVENELAVIVSRWSEDYDHAHPMSAEALREVLLGETRGPLVLLLAASGVVLLLACFNVAGLLLAQGEGRRREWSIRTALGAGRARLARQMLTESTLLGVCGGLAGIAVAGGALALLRLLEPGDLPRLEGVGLHLPVLLFALAVALATGLLFGLTPMLHAFKLDLVSGLRDGARGGGAAAPRQRLRGALVIAEVAVAVVLLVGASLLAKSFIQMAQSDVGVEPDNVLTARLSLPASSYPESGDVVDFVRQRLPELASLPGVRSAGVVNNLPFSGGVRLESFHVEGRSIEPGDEGIGADLQMVTADYFTTMGIPLLRGRAFTDADRADAPRVVILTESVARGVFPSEDPIGQRLQILAARPDEPTFEVVGVVGDVEHFGARDGVRPQLYLPLEQGITQIGGVPRSLTTVLKTAIEPASVVAPLRRAVHAADPDLALSRVATLRASIDGTLERPRFITALVGGFGWLALLLAAVGIYALLAHVVGLRRRELGLRLALGSTPGGLTSLVLRRGLGLVAVGLAAGWAACVVAGLLLDGTAISVFETQLFETRLFDRDSFLFASVALAAVAFFACYLPARRAAGVDPARTLRQD